MDYDEGEGHLVKPFPSNNKIILLRESDNFCNFIELFVFFTRDYCALPMYMQIMACLVIMTIFFMKTDGDRG